MPLEVVLGYVDGVEEAFREMYAPMAQASTLAMEDTTREAQALGRASIAAGGFSQRWQNALRYKVYPSPARAYAVNAAGWLYHNIPYAIVFEDGASIAGRPMLWIPLQTAPKRVGRGKVTPKKLSQIGVDLFPVKQAGGRPLLGARVRVSKREASNGIKGPVSLSKLKKGAEKNTARGTRRRGVLTTVPLFFGIDSVRIMKKFDVRGAAQTALSRFPEHYTRRMETLANG